MSVLISVDMISHPTSSAFVTYTNGIPQLKQNLISVHLAHYEIVRTKAISASYFVMCMMIAFYGKGDINKDTFSHLDIHCRL